MIVHFTDDGEIGGNHAAQLSDDLLELARDGALDIA